MFCGTNYSFLLCLSIEISIGVFLCVYFWFIYFCCYARIKQWRSNRKRKYNVAEVELTRARLLRKDDEVVPCARIPEISVITVTDPVSRPVLEDTLYLTCLSHELPTNLHESSNMLSSSQTSSDTQTKLSNSHEEFSRYDSLERSSNSREESSNDQMFSIDITTPDLARRSYDNFGFSRDDPFRKSTSLPGVPFGGQSYYRFMAPDDVLDKIVSCEGSPVVVGGDERLI